MGMATWKAEEVISLKITLRGIRPPIWRRLEVPSRLSLGGLHDAIQAAMGWGGHHLYVFDVAGRSYGDPAMVDDVADDERLTVGGVLKAGVRRFTYTYDFGDDWSMKSSSKERRLRLATVDTRLVRLAREIARRTTVAVFGGTEIFLQF
jgi:Plasmid pRiA4b ORF-3-like protein